MAHAEFCGIRRLVWKLTWGTIKHTVQTATSHFLPQGRKPNLYADCIDAVKESIFLILQTHRCWRKVVIFDV
jgi:hypothetical protein